MSFDSGRLAERRRAAGLTQMQLSGKLNVSVASLRRWEAGRFEPGASALGQLATHLGTTMRYLLGLTDNSSGALAVMFSAEEVQLIFDYRAAGEGWKSMLAECLRDAHRVVDVCGSKEVAPL
jgi:transcriptional regulator with XRE-family HTH domain